MFQLSSPSTILSDPTLVCDDIYMRAPRLADYASWAKLREDSRSHLTQWEDDWSARDLSLSKYRRRIRVWERQRRQAGALSLFVFRTGDKTMLGGVTLSNIRRGAAQSAILGYWVGAPFTRRGYGRLAVAETVRHAFDKMGLHRLEAACQPDNQASAALLLSLGFRREGRARDYLRINGVWRDHDIYARIADTPQPGVDG